MRQEELQVLLEELLKPSSWGIVFDISTLVLSIVSILVAIYVAGIYYKQGKIFKEQAEINQQQLELNRIELMSKRFEFIPNFVLTTRMIRSSFDSDLFTVEEFTLKIPNYSRVKEVQKVEIEINGKNFLMKSSNSMEKAIYRYQPNNYDEVVKVQANSINGIYSVECTVKITTIIFDEFEKKYLIELGVGGTTDEITKVTRELEYINSKGKK